MAVRIRPATTLAVVLAIAFAFHLITILSVPITSSITLCTYDGYKFGVFGLCHGDKCSNPAIGYSGKELGDVDGFSLPSNARHSVSKLLVVHPIAAGFVLISLVSSVLLHWHGPSNSLRFLFFLLLWTIPSFLISLLSFLVDILLFVPHLDWGGWIILASTVLIAISGVLLCIMRRTISSRRGLKRKDTFNNNDYHLQPLNYGYGTVDGNSDTKFGSKSFEGKDEDERAPFVHENDENYDNTMNVTRTNEDLNNYPSTQLYDSMRGENNRSAQSNSTGYRSPENILAPLSTAYRGAAYNDTLPEDSTQQHIINSTSPQPNQYQDEPYSQQQQPLIPQNTSSSPDYSAPYPTNLPNTDFPSTSSPPSQQQEQQHRWNAPYPEDNDYSTRSYDRNSTPHVGSRPSGPRPMPFASSGIQEELPLLPSEIAANTLNLNRGDIGQPSNVELDQSRESNESPSAPPLPLDDDDSNDEYDDAETTLPAYPHEENPHPLVQETKRLYESEPPSQQQQHQHQQEDEMLQAPSSSNNHDVSRQATYRTKIANAIDQLQGTPIANNSEYLATNDSLLSSTSHLNLNASSNSVAANNQQHGNNFDDEDDDDLYSAPARSVTVVPEESEAPPLPSPSAESFQSDASSNYSSQVPSALNSPLDPPTRGHSLLRPNRGPSASHLRPNDSLYDHHERIPSASTISNKESSEDLYPLSDPLAKRPTPAPSFSNISITSSNFTSVSQRGINPKYLEKNPHEAPQVLRTPHTLQEDLVPSRQPTSTSPQKTKAPPQDLLIMSNPDFSISSPNKRNGKKKPLTRPPNY
ncbi:pH-response regulator protein [Wickerhamomyces ciferrii]|uniref:PH-response regulator protein n=1 Tax=Wickerhamomyces ciferrii (strain ATCC 14091 / BCRC 22168 / CBS 111 / JCM 3599 / NBRC 0793 / NRRL Y-1031 F-60-10) TaxID=1206466 RepID=K0KZA7_WICCF|nr:pH-response regulator protein [Wickerhamomyces ciferrii]CCH46689.1 pH-response regulator protein [Wickerhamomyces ciferrii]